MPGAAVVADRYAGMVDAVLCEHRDPETGKTVAGVCLALGGQAAGCGMNASLVIAIRPPEEGKSRLAAALAPAARAALIEQMFRHVLGTALAAGPAGGVHVIGRPGPRRVC